jgi:TRAP-type C4-dicarboxylate transport system substrate-binding protein
MSGITGAGEQKSASTSKPTLRVGGYAPVGSTHSRALDHFRECMAGEVGDAVEVEVLHNVMDLGRPATALFDMVRSGELTWCYYSTSYLGGEVPALDALEVPYLFTSVEDAHSALDGDLGALLASEIHAVLGYEVLGFWDNGFRHLTNRVRPIRSPDDAAGLSIRVQPNAIHEALARAWGMTPIAVELSEAIRLISEGRVDAQENPLANTVAYGVDHHHVTLTGHLYGARGLYASAETMRAFPSDIADACRRCARRSIEFQRAAAAEYEKELLAAMIAEGRQVVVLTEDERAEFEATANEVAAAAGGDMRG